MTRTFWRFFRRMLFPSTASVCLLSTAPSLAQWTQPRVLCNLKDKQITEASGIALGRRNPGVFFIHNDSGDTARFFAVGKDGETRLVVIITNVKARDIEDIAVAGDAKGHPIVYLADIGDNPRQRSSVSIYSVPEPLASGRSVKTLSVRATEIRFKYPDGPHDAETLLAEPDSKALYVVTKSAEGLSIVFRVNPRTPGTQTAVKVGEVRFDEPFPLYPNLATGGDISADGRRAVIRTYEAVYEWTIPTAKTFADALTTKPVMTMLMMEQQGEGICYGDGGKSLYTDREKALTPILEYKRKAVTAE